MWKYICTFYDSLTLEFHRLLRWVQPFESIWKKNVKIYLHFLWFFDPGILQGVEVDSQGRHFTNRQTSNISATLCRQRSNIPLSNRPLGSNFSEICIKSDEWRHRIIPWIDAGIPNEQINMWCHVFLQSWKLFCHRIRAKCRIHALINYDIIASDNDLSLI